MMGTTPSEPFGTWAAKRLTIGVAVVLGWSWFVNSPASAAGIIDRTADAWCRVFPCVSPGQDTTGVGTGVDATGDAITTAVAHLQDHVGDRFDQRDGDR